MKYRGVEIQEIHTKRQHVCVVVKDKKKKSYTASVSEFNPLTPTSAETKFLFRTSIQYQRDN